MRLTDRPFPINYLRNVALKNTRTELVFYVEVDFVPSKNLRSEVARYKSTILREKKSVFIVPCFNSRPGTTAEEIPDTKEALRAELGLGKKFDVFHSKTHDALNIDYWMAQEDIYTLTVNREFEPYYIGHRNYPLFDEIFYGCGFDKIPHMMEMRNLGYSIRVLPRGIIVHLDSDTLGGKSWCKGWRKVPRRYIKRGMFFHRVNHTPGLFFNRYNVPWYRDYYNESGGGGTEKVGIEKIVYDDRFATGEDLYNNFVADKLLVWSLRMRIVVLYVVIVCLVVLVTILVVLNRRQLNGRCGMGPYYHRPRHHHHQQQQQQQQQQQEEDQDDVFNPTKSA